MKSKTMLNNPIIKAKIQEVLKLRGCSVILDRSNRYTNSQNGENRSILRYFEQSSYPKFASGICVKKYNEQNLK